VTEAMQTKSAIELATEIVIAFLEHRSVEPSELSGLVREVRAALEGGAGPRETEGPPTAISAPVALDPEEGRGAARASSAPRQVVLQPAVPADQSVFPDYLVSLEDGIRYRSLRRHLMARYGLTPDDYRKKWDLPADYPMVAPNYARERSEVARRSGLGKRGKTRAGDQSR
jgi:predicted transcriptional regulator